MATVAIDPAAIAEYVRSPDGPILRHMLLVGDKVKEATVAQMRSDFPRGFVGPKVVKRILMASDGPHVLVGADNLKTRPHGIDGNPLLVFYWPKAGRTMYLRHVNHPGSDFTQYLAAKLLAALQLVRL